VYSKRIFDPDHSEQDQLKETALPNLNASTSSAGTASETSNTTATQLSLEQTTKSLEKLYVNPVTDLSPKSLNSTTSTPLLSQYVPGSTPSGNSSILASVQAADPLLSFNGNSANAKPFTAKATAGPQSSYNTLLGNNPSAILNNGLNPLAPSVGMGNMLGMPMNNNNNTLQGQSILQQVPNQGQQGQGQAGHQQHQQNPQPAYYVQQAVYLDQNGQPIFYRPGEYINEYILRLLISLARASLCPTFLAVFTPQGTLLFSLSFASSVTPPQ